MDISYAKADDYATPDSNPWGTGGVPDESVAAYGQAEETGFYDARDDMVGGSDTQWNLGADNRMAGANWASAGDNAPTFIAPAGLGGERTKFSGDLSQESLAGNVDNTGNFSPV